MEFNKNVKSLFEKYYIDNHFSGVGLIKKGNKTLFSGTYGYAHRGWKIKNDILTKFDTASITKLFTSVAILQLIDQDMLSFDDRVMDMLDIEDSTISHDVTVYHLLTHTSGIGDDADEEAGEDYEEIWRHKPNYSVTETEDFLPQFIHKEPNFEPGKGCRYNNVAFVLLGLLIEKVTKIKYRDYIKEHIFNPVGMDKTGFYSKDEIDDNVAEGYISITDDQDRVVSWKKNIYSFPPIGSPDGGAYTCAEDLDLFVRAIIDGKLLSKTMSKSILQPKEVYRKHTKVTEMMGFGFEFVVSNSDKQILYMKKDGSNAGVACFFAYYPNIDTTLVLLANQDCNIWDLAWDIQTLLIGDIS